MGETDLLKLAFQYGPGLVVAVIVLLWKRADDQRYMNDLRTLIETNNSVLRELVDAVRELKEYVNVDATIERLEERLEERLSKRERVKAGE